MDTIAKFENTIGDWLKPMPHLPVNGQKWLAKNVWWIVLVGLVLLAISMVMLIGAIMVALPFIFATAAYTNYYGSATYTGLWMVGSVVSLIFVITTIILTAVAISPLKKQLEKGWNLLFITMMISALSVVVNSIISFNLLSFIPSLMSGAIGLMIGMYFLYEIRSHFNSTTTVKKTK